MGKYKKFDFTKTRHYWLANHRKTFSAVNFVVYVERKKFKKLIN